MAVESVTKISDLNELWPLGTDPKSEGDQHIRNIKKALKAADGGAIVRIAVTNVVSSQTYTKPAGLKFLEVQVIGGGGGGTAAPATAAGQAGVSGGGGGGGYVRKIYPTSGLSATVSITIGASGAVASGVGGDGGSSSFGGGPTAGGGTGGGAIQAAGTTLFATPRGVGGSASGGDLNITGQNAAPGVRCAHGNVSTATTSPGGMSALVTAWETVTTGAASGALGGKFPGGGACGAANGASQGQGGASGGGAGLVILREYF